MTTQNKDVTSVGEFEFIDAVVSRLPAGDDCLIGPGDDAAVVRAPDSRVVACTDVLVDGRHFRRDWSSALDIGHRAAAANMADIAAMGARTTALLVGMCIPVDVPLMWSQELATGLGSEAARVGASVVGGDTVRSTELTIAVTALGDLEGREPVTRAGAKPGDVVAVAGRLGWAAAGYTILSRGFRSPGVLVAAHRQPDVFYDAGPAAAKNGATSMIDVSDGLLADLAHVTEESGVSIDIKTAALKLSDQMRNTGQALGVNPLHWVLTGGDDHALVATFPAGTVLDSRWVMIGEVNEGSGVTVDGDSYSEPHGWDHFRSNLS